MKGAIRTVASHIFADSFSRRIDHGGKRTHVVVEVRLAVGGGVCQEVEPHSHKGAAHQDGGGEEGRKLALSSDVDGPEYHGKKHGGAAGPREDDGDGASAGGAVALFVSEVLSLDCREDDEEGQNVGVQGLLRGWRPSPRRS